MDASTKKGLMWLAILAVGGIGVYEYMKHKAAEAAPPPPGGTLSPETAAILTSLPGTLPIASTPVSNTAAAAPISAPAIPAAEVSLVQNWAYDVDGRPPVMAFAQAMQPEEYDGMYALIQAWDSVPPGQQFDPTAAQTQFWNDLRDKYDPTHQYW